ncbi:MAG TPA: non-oxidative hydroxyarylic acid decarboxylases subunit C [Thermodesulfobacteriota bacterium]|nr:non-oxidative hydroxyarylic acid decarboxylases subunit C [Thermodesulfobacteriota bacterium]
MAYQNLRDFLSRLESEGQLLKIQKEVLPEPEIGAAAYAAGQIPNGPAILFEKIRGYDQKKVVMNVHGSWRNYALMLDLPIDTSLQQLFHELIKKSDRFPISPKVADRAPLKETILTKNINLFETIPVFRVNDYDGGPYLSKAIVVSKDPENLKNQNLGIYRLQVKDKDRLGIQTSPQHDIAVNLRKAEELNQPLPVAIALGNDPVLSLAAGMPLQYDEDEYEMAGALRGEPVEIIRAETVDLMVPAGAEVVLEGEIVPRKRTIEGPFGEYPGFYSPTHKQAEIKIKAITLRKDPILFENLYIGKPWSEHDYLIGPITSATLYRQLKAMAPEVVSVNAMYCHGYGTIVSTKSRIAGYAKIIAAKLLATPHGLVYPKLIVVVDEDIDPFNLNEVMWALVTRFRPDRDLIFIPNAPASTLDPTSHPRGLVTRMILDATQPVPPDLPLEGLSLLTPPKEAPEWVELLSRMMRK